ncbi:MAG: hypothetical protein J5802_10340 [Butyrivibrio sp.]|nr:hypothetical protein [Butyrivibrio sp.]
MSNKLKFFLPPIVLAVITWIWLFYEKGRWYTYRSEPLYAPLLILHILVPIYYFVVFIKQIGTNNHFYKVSSGILFFLTLFGALIFMVFTSGA